MRVFDWSGLDGPFFCAFGLSIALCALLVWTRRWHGRYTNDDFNGPQKFHSHDAPRIGGLAMAFAFALMWPFLPDEIQPIWAVIGLAGIPALAAGLAEDLTRRVSVYKRLLATMAAGGAFAVASGYMITSVDLPGVDWLLAFVPVAILFTAFSVGGVANAINIIDGFNGLAAGALLIMFGAFAYVARAVGDPLVLSLATLYAAIVLGFFVWNFPGGRIFLGDGGAYFCGYLLATLGVLLAARNEDVSAWTALLICAYPVIETLASMRRKSRREGHSAGKPDRVHFHMLAYRRYARRLVPAGGPRALRNPATSIVTWLLPLLTTAFVVMSYDKPLLSAMFFFVTVWVYGVLYRAMSLNASRLPLGLARLL